MSSHTPIKDTLHEVIFEADTPSGKLFDILLLWAIVLSVLAIMLETVESIRVDYGDLLRYIEWGFTILFSIEYLLRIYCVKKPVGYMLSFYGVIDFLSILPTYLSLLLAGTHYLMVIRSIRLLRVFRVLKLARYLGESRELTAALRASQHKITVFLGGVFVTVIIVGTLFYVIEGPENGYSSIPKGVYWAVVTLTTVGYGDITPGTPLGQLLSAMVMILGYGIIAVPTGIVSAEMARAGDRNSQNNQPSITTTTCKHCSREGHAADAIYCKYCSSPLG